MQVIACWMRLYVEINRMEKGLDVLEAEWYERAK